MKIGGLAKATGSQVETIRYYERAGLLPEPSRTVGNYREYSLDHIERLSFIRHCRSLDMSLDEIRVLLKFKDSPTDNCGEVNGLLDEHIQHVATRVAALKSLEAQLRQLRRTCRVAQAARECGILAGLSSATQVATRESTKIEAVQAHVHGSHRTGTGSSRPKSMKT